MKKFIKEFKDFAIKGNVLDMAVGVMIASAFGKIVTSLVEDVLMPIISILIGKEQFSSLKIVVQSSAGEVNIAYGNFIQSVVNFLFVALCVFIFVKIITRITSTFKKEEVVKEDKPDENIVLLTEIRDLLKERNNNGC